VKLGDRELSEGEDYDVEYGDNTNVGPATSTRTDRWMPTTWRCSSTPCTTTPGSWGSVLLIIFYVENLDVGSWGVKNDV
jgi:hypothetical protein